MTEHGTDRYGAEYKRTPHDFSFRLLTQDNCVCNICHGTGAVIEFEYTVRNYQSPKTKKICKRLQEHRRSFWICPKCINNINEAGKQYGVIATVGTVLALKVGELLQKTQ